MTSFRPASQRTLIRLSLLTVLLFALATSGCSNETDVEQSLQGPGPVAMMAASEFAPDFCPTLPDYPVVVIHTQRYTPDAVSLFNIWFWGIGSTGGYDVTDGDWNGWCLEDNSVPNVRDPGRITLWCSFDPELPGNLGELPINELNYLINHKVGTMPEIQAAIWLLTWGSSEYFTPTETSYAMLEDAQNNGADFVPGPGDLVAIFCYTGDGGIAPGPEGFQETFIEYLLPGDDGGDFAACTPGYWKTHFDRWPEGFSASDDFDATFGTDYFAPDITLGEATWARGGGVKKLARHGTSALLNAAHGDVEYAYTMDEVIAMVRDGDADPMADANDEYDCPLGGTSADPKASRKK